MDIIQLLPDSVANQIAAGEVIQRPASVIKELVENAVDAGARHIDIIVVDAGRTSIQVVDDGKGMSETDARLAFERHATSKIHQAADLFSLTTMGFRGEALPSIAAVAQVELLTRTADSDLGTHLVIEGSRVLSQEPEACHVGASFVVKNLFFNTPARRKFLKTNQTELNNITTEVERIVLVHPEIAFTLTSNGAPLMSLQPCSLKQRIANVFGQRMADRLLTVEVETPMVRIHGFAGTPESSRKRGAAQYFFVNQRYMRHPYFHRAVQEAYAQLLPSDEQVPYFLYFEVEPSEIDVNIHPTKTEIKFENEQAIWQILLAALRESLGRFNAMPTIDFDTEGRPTDIPVFNPTAHTTPPKVKVDDTFNPFEQSPATHAYHPTASRSTEGWEKLYIPDDVQLSLDLLPPTEEKSAEHYQYKGAYIITTVQSGLMLIDQHRAHLRVLYDTYLAQMATSPSPSQRLLFPEVLQLPVSDATILQSVLPDIVALGFDLNDLGGGSWSLSGYPAGFEGVHLQRVLTELIASVRELGSVAPDALRSRVALTLARAAAIPAGQVLSPQEMQDLVNKLFATQAPNFTPDGHPIIVIIQQDQIDKMFK